MASPIDLVAACGLAAGPQVPQDRHLRPPPSPPRAAWWHCWRRQAHRPWPVQSPKSLGHSVGCVPAGLGGCSAWVRAAGCSTQARVKASSHPGQKEERVGTRASTVGAFAAASAKRRPLDLSSAALRPWTRSALRGAKCGAAGGGAGRPSRAPTGGGAVRSEDVCARRGRWWWRRCSGRCSGRDLSRRRHVAT